MAMIALQKSRKNPYSLAREMFGVGFKTADQIANELEIPRDAKVRVEAGIEYVLNAVCDDGHVCYPEDKLIALAEKMLEVDQARIIGAINTLEGEKTDHPHGARYRRGASFACVAFAAVF